MQVRIDVVNTDQNDPEFNPYDVGQPTNAKATLSGQPENVLSIVELDLSALDVHHR